MTDYEKMWNLLKELVKENEKHMGKISMELHIKKPNSNEWHTSNGARQAFKSIRTDMEFAEEEFKEEE